MYKCKVRKTKTTITSKSWHTEYELPWAGEWCSWVGGAICLVLYWLNIVWNWAVTSTVIASLYLVISSLNYNQDIVRYLNLNYINCYNQDIVISSLNYNQDIVCYLFFYHALRVTHPSHWLPTVYFGCRGEIGRSSEPPGMLGRPKQSSQKIIIAFRMKQIFFDSFLILLLSWDKN
jgi:hypothetical protein